jgi:hypothetical protein
MPSLSLLMPWSSTFNLALSTAPLTSLSGGPWRRSSCRDMPSAALDVLVSADLCRLRDTAAFEGRFNGEGASLFARCLWGDRWAPYLRVGDEVLAGRSRCLCCAINEGWFFATAPRLFTDCSLRSVRCACGVGGAFARARAGTGTESLVGLGILRAIDCRLVSQGAADLACEDVVDVEPWASRCPLGPFRLSICVGR